MRPFILILIAFFALAIISCKKDHQTNSTTITGSWRWVQSVGGIAGVRLTPQNTGKNFTDIFYADSTYKRYQNDTLLIQGQFSIIKNYKFNSQVVDLLKAGEGNKIMHISNDTLYMEDAFIADGFDDVYVRLQK